MPRKTQRYDTVQGARTAVAQLGIKVEWPGTFGKLADKARQKRAEGIFEGIVARRQPNDWNLPDLHLAAELSMHFVNISDAVITLTDEGPLIEANSGAIKPNPILKNIEVHRCAISRIMRDLQINLKATADARTVQGQAKAFREAQEAFDNAGDLIARPN